MFTDNIVSGRTQSSMKAYTGLGMKRFLATTLILIFSAVGLLAAEKQYQDAIILTIEQKSNVRVLYYVVNTPITKEEPYYQISLRLNQTIYFARYTPRHSLDTLPEDWTTAARVQARADGRHLFVKRSVGTDVELVITKHRPVKATDKDPQPAPVDK